MAYIPWVGFVGFVILMLALDLGVFHRKAHTIEVREALGWSLFWISLGLGFAGIIYLAYENHWFALGNRVDTVDGLINGGRSAVAKYLTGYIVEKSLSVDNIFVIAMIFRFFGVPGIYQHRVLFWGILGALVMRGAMIGIGAALISRFHWMFYIFGIFLIVTAVKMFLMKTEHQDPNRNIVVRLSRRLFPVTSGFHRQRFLVRAGSSGSRESDVPGGESIIDEAAERAKPGTLMMTPLALALIMVETTDLIFAVDSIPAIFAITADPFIVFTSNVFAILGLRSLYFALAGMLDRFRYLKVSLALVLLLIGVKMMIAKWLKDLFGANFNAYLLGVILLILAVGVAASLIAGRKEQARSAR